MIFFNTIFPSQFFSDFDECLARSDDCEQTCVNTHGSFRCECQTGFILEKDRKTCRGKLSHTWNHSFVHKIKWRCLEQKPLQRGMWSSNLSAIGYRYRLTLSVNVVVIGYRYRVTFLLKKSSLRITANRLDRIDWPNMHQRDYCLRFLAESSN